MEENLKQLLLKDLWARLPYGVYAQVRYKEGEPCYGKLTPRDIQWFIDSNIEVIKPYLRPMSSMTKEEDEEWWEFENKNTIVESHSYSVDWLNAHHFDYRGLIPKGLALVAPEGMYE